MKNQDEFFNKIYEHTIPEIETIYRYCERFGIRLEGIDHFPHVDFLPDEQDAFIKLNERLGEITDEESDMDLMGFLYSISEQQDSSSRNEKLKDAINGYGDAPVVY